MVRTDNALRIRSSATVASSRGRTSAGLEVRRSRAAQVTECKYGDGVSATRGELVPSPIRFPRTKTPSEMRYSEGSGLEGAEYVCVLELIYVCYANLDH